MKEKEKAVTVTIYTTSSCGDCLRTKSYLDQRGIAYEEINIERAPEAALFVKSANHGKRKVPTLVVGDEVFHNSPYNRAILDAHFNRE
jgi:mycoredoxin